MMILRLKSFNTNFMLLLSLFILCYLTQIVQSYHLVRSTAIIHGRHTVGVNNLFSRHSLLHHSNLYMAASGGRGGGSTKLDRKTSIKTDTKQNLKDEIEKDWRLILHDDTVHTIQQVCDILTMCCPLCTGPRAYEVTLEVHMTGAGTVAVANKKIVTEYTKSLQAAGLTVSMSPDDEFEGGESEGD